MGLVKITTAYRNIGPIDVGLFLDDAEHFLESSHSTKEFWSQPDFSTEKLYEPSGAETDFLRQVGDGSVSWHTVKFV